MGGAGLSNNFQVGVCAPVSRCLRCLLSACGLTAELFDVWTYQWDKRTTKYTVREVYECLGIFILANVVATVSDAKNAKVYSSLYLHMISYVCLV